MDENTIIEEDTKPKIIEIKDMLSKIVKLPEATNNIVEEDNKPKIDVKDLLTKIVKSPENKQYNAVTNLLDKIILDKEKTNDKLFILSAAYDRIFKKFNTISLAILILSSIVTLIEAFRLSIVEFSNNADWLNINTVIISFIVNILSLSIGTIITILSSIVRFKNYREILEQLKDKQNLLINYRDKYNKKYEKILNLLAFDCLSIEEIKTINEKINEYDNEIKTINVMEYLRNEHILRFNKYKALFDFELRKLEIDKYNAIQKYEKNAGVGIDFLNDEKKQNNLQQYNIIKKAKETLLNKNKSNKNIIEL